LDQRAGREAPQALAQLEALARDLIAEKKFGEAEQILDEALTPAFVSQPSSADVLDLRFNLMARRGRWQEAASDAALLLEYRPAEHYYYHALAPLLVMTHDRPAYEQLCRKIIAMFANATNAAVADRIAQDCLLLPDSGVDLHVVDKLADTAVTVGSGDTLMPFFQTCKAMSNYRQGRFLEAIEWVKRPLEGPVVCAQAKACAILAMAQWRLGEKDPARATLAKGETLASGIFSVRDAGDLKEGWVAWLHTRVSLDEAAALVQPVSSSENESNKP
jgi:eukaryotic-like serine/threonine-protein kinase